MLEMIVYIAIFGLCMTVFMRAIAHVMNVLHHVDQQSVSLMSATTALDCCARDIWSAQPYGIHSLLEQSFVIMGPRYDVGWICEGDRLYRIKGMYDSHAHQWIKRKRNIVTTGISDFSYVITAAHDTITISIGDITRTVSVKNRKW